MAEMIIPSTRQPLDIQVLWVNAYPQDDIKKLWQLLLAEPQGALLMQTPWILEIITESEPFHLSGLDFIHLYAISMPFL